MMSTTSLFNRELLTQILRSNGWIAALYLLGLFFALPLSMIMIFTSDQQNAIPTRLDNLFSLLIEVQIMLLIAVPVLLGVFLFRYFMVKQSADLIHSLPVKREKVFHHYVVMGIAFLVIPVLLIALFMLGLHLIFHLDMYYSLGDIFYWTGVSILFNLLFFFATVFIGVLTGISAVQGVLTYIFLLFPAGIMYLLFYQVNFFLYGFSRDYSLKLSIEKASPITFLININHEVLSIVQVLIYIAAIILFYVLSIYLYKNRKLERVSEAFVFSGVIPVFKYGTAFCFMLLGGTYFGETQGHWIWRIFGYAAGSLFGYFIAEMVLQKSWRVFKSIKGYFLFSAVMIGIFGVFQLDVTGFEKRLPQTSEIKKVYFGDSPYSYMDDPNVRFFEEEENIEAVQNLHKEILENDERNQSASRFSRSAFFIYELHSGKQIVREYLISNVDDYASLYKPIVESEEYKEMHNEIVTIDPDDVDKISIYSHRDSLQDGASITDEKDIQEAIKLIKDDIYSETYEETETSSALESSIEVLLANNKSIHLTLKNSYETVNQWLKDKKLFDLATINADDVSHVWVMKNDRHNQEDLLNMDVETIISTMESNGIKLENKSEIQESLDAFQWDSDGLYMIAVIYKGNDFHDIGSFSEDAAPDFIRTKLD